MPEKHSSIENVYGKGLAEAKKADVFRGAEEVFDEQKFGNLKDIEKDKSSPESQVISLANEATNELRNRYGLKDFNIPEKNIHIIEKDKWRDKNGNAMFSLKNQGAVVRETPSQLTLAEKVFHEMAHFKSYGALQLVEGGQDPKEYRSGLTVTDREGKERYFNSLNEAVTTELTKRFISGLKDNDLFKDEFKKNERVLEENPDMVDSSGEKIDLGEVFSSEVIGKNPETGGNKVHLETFGYEKERKVLDNLISKLQEANEDKFRNKEEIFDVFAKAMFTGNILPLGRIIDQTFGKGTFRKIGESGRDIKLQAEFIESLNGKEAGKESKKSGERREDQQELQNLGTKYGSLTEARKYASSLKKEIFQTKEDIDRIRQEMGLISKEVVTASSKSLKEAERRLKEIKDEISGLEKEYLGLPEKEGKAPELKEEEINESLEETAKENSEERKQELGETRRQFVEEFIDNATDKFSKDFKKYFKESANGAKAAPLLAYKVRYAVESKTKEWITDGGDADFQTHVKIFSSKYESEKLGREKRFITDIKVRFNATETEGSEDRSEEREELISKKQEEELKAAEREGALKKEERD